MKEELMKTTNLKLDKIIDLLNIIVVCIDKNCFFDKMIETKKQLDEAAYQRRKQEFSNYNYNKWKNS